VDFNAYLYGGANVCAEEMYLQRGPPLGRPGSEPVRLLDRLELQCPWWIAQTEGSRTAHNEAENKRLAASEIDRAGLYDARMTQSYRVDECARQVAGPDAGLGDHDCGRSMTSYMDQGCCTVTIDGHTHRLPGRCRRPTRACTPDTASGTRSGFVFSAAQGKNHPVSERHCTRTMQARGTEPPVATLDLYFTLSLMAAKSLRYIAVPEVRMPLIWPRLPESSVGVQYSPRVSRSCASMANVALSVASLYMCGRAERNVCGAPGARLS
jgi:hypothetical protein